MDLISDQQKGLVESIAQFLPRAQHRLYARHVYANLREKYKGLKYRDIFWRIAKSSNEVEFEMNKKTMEQFDPYAWKFLEEKNPEQWCRLFFDYQAKYDLVDNNMAEIFDAFIIEAFAYKCLGV